MKDFAPRSAVPAPEHSRFAPPISEQLGPLLESDNEQHAWNCAAEILHHVFAADDAATFEFAGTDRAMFRSSIDFSDFAHDTPFPIAPDSQAAYLRTSDSVCVANEISADPRFVAPRLLTALGFRSSMGVSFPLAGGGRGIVGVYSREAAYFAGADCDTIRLVARVLGSVLDRLRHQNELEVRARTDSLTGLDNRSTVLASLDERIREGREVSALLIDLDGFKSVNDQHGHRIGDSVLQVVAKRLERSLEVDDRLGRLGGDEFLAVFDGHVDALRAEQLIGHVEEVIMVESRTVGLSASIGISRSRPGDDVSAMLERADLMMYAAKTMGRGHVRADDCVAPVAERRPASSAPRTKVDLALVDEAIAELNMLVQPIVKASTGVLHGVEALTRGGRGSPLEFPDRLFDAATTFGRLDVLELESKRLAFGLKLPAGLPLYINLEPELLCDTEWFDRLADAWRTSGSGRPVVAEVTERAVMANPGRLLRAVSACRQLGWQIALDDVGARSESLAALRWIEPDIVKLDMSLIRHENPAHSAHVAAAVAAYRSHRQRRHVMVIAEGVETQADAELACVLGADLLQGYLYGRPGSVDDLTRNGETSGHRSTSRGVTLHGERIGTKSDLLSMSRNIETYALSDDCVVLSTMQHVEHFTRRTRRQYRAMARRCGFVGVLVTDVSSIPPSEVTGIRLGDLARDDPLTNTWQVLVMSPTTSVGLIATELQPADGIERGDMDRLFHYRLVSDPSDVEAAVRNLLRYF